MPWLKLRGSERTLHIYSAEKKILDNAFGLLVHLEQLGIESAGVAKVHVQQVITDVTTEGVSDEEAEG